MKENRVIKKAVILGAGKTGRGYLARLLAMSEVSLSFIDENRILVENMKKAGNYVISFFGSNKQPVKIDGFQIFGWEEPEAKRRLREADLICTAVGAERLAGLVPELKKNILCCDRREAEKPILLVCENGIHPGSVLKKELGDFYTVAEGIVFCTTIEEGLDIRSEDLDWLPYDGNRIAQELELSGFEKETRFAELLGRKIYTYNFLSACICYFGAERGYEVFSEAAMDFFVQEQIRKIRGPLNRAVAKEYGVSQEEQDAFFRKAFGKFTDKNIADTVSRNARNVRRKLGRNERIVGPLYLAVKYGEPREGFERLAASALYYGENTGEFRIRGKGQAERLLKEAAGIREKELIWEIMEMYRNIEKQE